MNFPVTTTTTVTMAIHTTGGSTRKHLCSHLCVDEGRRPGFVDHLDDGLCAGHGHPKITELDLAPSPRTPF